MTEQKMLKIETQKELLIAGISGRSEKALAAIAKADNPEKIANIVAVYIWESMGILDLLDDEIAGRTTQKLDLQVEKEKEKK
jgi:hypothetical protein